jgi:Fur family ferric uptake transcriptional regulator
MKQPQTGRWLAELRKALHRQGLRATAPRIAVLALLRRADRPLSHADVAKALAGEAWDRSTLYRNLLDLVTAGLAYRTELGDRLWRFVDATRHTAGDHPHFVCVECGKIKCLPGMQVTWTPENTGPQALRQHQCEVQMRGLCDDCQ